MIQGNKPVVALAGLALLAFAAWQWHAHDTPAGSSSPSAASLTEARASTRAGAGSGPWAPALPTGMRADDPASRVSAFKQSNDCLLYHVAVERVGVLLDDPRMVDPSKETLATLEHIDAESARFLKAAQQLEDACSGSDRNQLAKIHSSALLDAALAGNADAQTCFVVGGIFPLENMDAAESARLLERYLQHAPAFTQSALERADPRVAADALFRYVASDPVHPSPVDRLAKADPYLTWRAARLAALRAVPEQRKRLEAYLQDFRATGILAAGEIERADAWALQTFEREFNGAPQIDVDSRAQCHAAANLSP